MPDPLPTCVDIKPWICLFGELYSALRQGVCSFFGLLHPLDAPFMSSDHNLLCSDGGGVKYSHNCSSPSSEWSTCANAQTNHLRNCAGGPFTQWCERFVCASAQVVRFAKLRKRTNNFWSIGYGCPKSFQQPPMLTKKPLEGPPKYTAGCAPTSH